MNIAWANAASLYNRRLHPKDGPLTRGPISVVRVTFEAGTIEAELSAHYFFRDIRQRAVVPEGICS